MSVFAFNPNLKQKIRGTLGKTPVLAHAFIARWTKTPVAATAANILGATLQPTSGTTVVTTFLAQPDVARNLTCIGNQATCTGNLVLAGTNLNGDAITETLAINGTTPVLGAKAFATITSATVPTRGAASDSITIGVGSKLGLHHKLTNDTVTRTHYNNVIEGTAPTVAFSATVLESNTVLLNTSLAGAVVDFFYYVSS